MAVLADCHIGRGGLAFPPGLFPRLQDADLIVTLGGMGERRGLDQLEEIAPVLGVMGADDDWDLRTGRATLVLGEADYRIGCVSDAVAGGFARSRHPFTPAHAANLACSQAFGGPVNILLHAGTHRAEETLNWPGGAALNPGSPVLPFHHDRGSFIRLKVTAQGIYGHVVRIDDERPAPPTQRRHTPLLYRPRSEV